MVNFWISIVLPSNTITYCLLSRKVKLSVQILMTLDNQSPSSSPEMSLLLLRYIKFFENFENCPMNFLHFQIFVTIHLFLPNLLITFASDCIIPYRISQNSFGFGVVIFFHFAFKVFKSIRVFPNFVYNVC